MLASGFSIRGKIEVPFVSWDTLVSLGSSQSALVDRVTLPPTFISKNRLCFHWKCYAKKCISTEQFTIQGDTFPVQSEIVNYDLWMRREGFSPTTVQFTRTVRRIIEESDDSQDWLDELDWIRTRTPNQTSTLC